MYYGFIGAHHEESASPILSLCPAAFLYIGLFLDLIFRKIDEFWSTWAWISEEKNGGFFNLPVKWWSQLEIKCVLVVGHWGLGGGLNS